MTEHQIQGLKEFVDQHRNTILNYNDLSAKEKLDYHRIESIKLFELGLTYGQAQPYLQIKQPKKVIEQRLTKYFVRWTDEEDIYLIKQRKLGTNRRIIADYLNRTLQSVEGRISHFKKKGIL